MKFKWFVLWFYAFALHSVMGQAVLKSQHEVTNFSAISQEKVYVHANASFLLTGEYLYYKIYCLDTKENGLSQLSKVGYVELIGKEGEPVFRHKVLLQNGLGQGDFFIPTDVASGVYKLVAYTRWMQNTDETGFYQKDITIVNPYRSNQPELQKSKVVGADSLAMAPMDTVVNSSKKTVPLKNSGPLQLNLNGTNFGKRTKVIISLEGVDTSDTSTGRYSVSIRKKDGSVTSDGLQLSDVMKKMDNFKNTTAAMGHTPILPELRGELFQGKVLAVQEGGSVKNLKVGVSIPGNDYVLEIVRTDDFGNFLVNIHKSYGAEQLFAQVLSENPEGYTIQINEPNTVERSKLDFKEMDIDIGLRDEIERRSVHSQIENSYFQFRPDSIVTVQAEYFLDNFVGKTYLLDDYTRFTTVRETLLEIVKDAISKRIDKDDYAIRVNGYDYTSLSDIPPLILLDGLLVQDHNTLLDFDARKIEQIIVYRQKLIYGPEIYEGAIILVTKEGAGYEAFGDAFGVKSFTVPRPRPIKKYFVQRYDTQGSVEFFSRLPDDRLQLLWEPTLYLTEKESRIDFFTSDVSGEFEIHLEGITADGRPVSIRSSFIVD